MKALDRWRLFRAHRVAVDGTGQLFHRKRHCPYCLTQKAANGETLYYLPLLLLLDGLSRDSAALASCSPSCARLSTPLQSGWGWCP
jgi:hypothetical protein